MQAWDILYSQKHTNIWFSDVFEINLPSKKMVKDCILNKVILFK